MARFISFSDKKDHFVGLSTGIECGVDYQYQLTIKTSDL